MRHGPQEKGGFTGAQLKKSLEEQPDHPLLNASLAQLYLKQEHLFEAKIIAESMLPPVSKSWRTRGPFKGSNDSQPTPFFQTTHRKNFFLYREARNFLRTSSCILF